MLERELRYTTASGLPARVIHLDVEGPNGKKALALVNEREYVLYNDDGTPYTLDASYALTRTSVRDEVFAYVKDINYKDRTIVFERYYATRANAERFRPSASARLARITIED